METLRGLRSDFDKFRLWARQYRPIPAAFLFYVSVVVLDYASTKFVEHAHIQGLVELNEFARNTQGKFLMGHAIVADLIFLVAYIGMSVFGVYAISFWHKQLARIIPAVLVFYVGFDRLTDAVFTNFLFGLRLHQDLKPDDILRRLFQ